MFPEGDQKGMGVFQIGSQLRVRMQRYAQVSSGEDGGSPRKTSGEPPREPSCRHAKSYKESTCFSFARRPAEKWSSLSTRISEHLGKAKACTIYSLILSSIDYMRNNGK